MIKSITDKVGVGIVIVGCIIFIGLSIALIYDWFYHIDGILKIQRIILPFITFIIGPIYILIELPKLKRVEIGKNEIVLVHLITGNKKILPLQDIDGFKTMFQWSSSNVEIILIFRGAPIHFMSSSYIKNIDQIKSALSRRVPDLGIEEFQYFKYLRQHLLKR